MDKQIAHLFFLILLFNRLAGLALFVFMMSERRAYLSLGRRRTCLAHGHDEGKDEGDEHEVEEARGTVGGAEARHQAGEPSTRAALEDVGGGVEDGAAGCTSTCVRLVCRHVAHWGEGGGAGQSCKEVLTFMIVMLLENYNFDNYLQYFLKTFLQLCSGAKMARGRV